MKILLFILITAFSVSSVNGKEVVVEIYKKKFIPAQVTIAKGDTVIWKNIEKRQYHNVWFQQLDKDEPDYIFPDESYKKSFNSIGSFKYICGPHPKMMGLVIVK